jgi:hypothetical protein
MNRFEDMAFGEAKRALPLRKNPVPGDSADWKFGRKTVCR